MKIDPSIEGVTTQKIYPIKVMFLRLQGSVHNVGIYLQEPKLPDIYLSIRHFAQFCNNLCLVREPSIWWISNYLANTSIDVDLPGGNHILSTCGLVYNPDKEKVIGCYIYSYSAGSWSQLDTNNSENSMLHLGSVITYTWCLVLWYINI